MTAAERLSRDAEFVEFMSAAQPELLRTARYLTGSDDLARELTQDALTRAYGISVGTVKSSAARGLAALRSLTVSPDRTES